jgi:predicted Rossmann fold nucleotide-binding protein DprA/Smf involved in DNA uptake
MSPDVLARVRAEIDERLAQLRPAAEEHQRLLAAADALGLDIDAPARAGGSGGAQRRKRRSSPAGATARASSARHPAAEQAIVAALEHGSHTVAELVVVTAMPGGEIRASLRRLQGAGTVTRTRREGRTAYTLSPSA